jgi:hypothetical protein
MKRAMIKTLTPNENYYVGELERSGNPRSEFHTVVVPLQGDNGDTQSAIKYIIKIKA